MSDEPKDPDIEWAREAADDERFDGAFALQRSEVINRRASVLLEAQAVEAERCSHMADDRLAYEFLERAADLRQKAQELKG
jgi:hypothetical protein